MKALLLAGLLTTTALTAQASYNGFQAVTFDGATYLSNPGTDPSLKLPATATKGLIAYDYQAAGTLKPYGVICWIDNDNGGGFWVIHSTQSDGTMLVELSVSKTGSVVGGLGAWATIPTTNWHQMVVSFDATVPSAEFDLDGVALPIHYAPRNDTTGVITFNEPILIGAQPGPGNFYKGDLAEVWAYFGPGAPSVNQFYNTNTEEPRRISSDGQSVGKRPNFFLHGGFNTFLENDPSSIGYFSWTSSNPQSSFITAAGALVKAISDPWDFSIVGTAASARVSKIINARRRNALR